MTADIVMPHCSRRYQVKRCVFSSSHTCIIPSFVINRVYIGSVVSGSYTSIVTTIIRRPAVQGTARIVSRRYRKCGITARPVQDAAVGNTFDLSNNLRPSIRCCKAKSCTKPAGRNLGLGVLKRRYLLRQRSNIPILLTHKGCSHAPRSSSEAYEWILFMPKERRDPKWV